MNKMFPFQFKDMWVYSPDDLSDAIEVVNTKTEAVSLITKLTAAISDDAATKEHLRHACTCCSKLAAGSNKHISDAIVTVW